MLVLRCKYVHDMYVNDVSEASYVRLMSSDNKTTVKKLAMFVHGALKERDNFLEGKKCIYLLNSHIQNHYIMYVYVNCNLLLRSNVYVEILYMYNNMYLGQLPYISQYNYMYITRPPPMNALYNLANNYMYITRPPPMNALYNLAKNSCCRVFMTCFH